MRRKPASQAAFTLLEVLVVMLIIGTMAGIMIPKMLPDNSERLARDESQRLLRLLRMAGEDAVIRNQPMAVRFDPHGYVFMRREGDSWKIMEGDDVYRARELPTGMSLELVVDGSKSVTTGDIPQLIFVSTGEMTPIEITLQSRDLDRRYHISGSFFTDLELKVEDV
jgi:general secretion pathway protein H